MKLLRLLLIYIVFGGIVSWCGALVVLQYTGNTYEHYHDLKMEAEVGKVLAVDYTPMREAHLETMRILEKVRPDKVDYTHHKDAVFQDVYTRDELGLPVQSYFVAHRDFAVSAGRTQRAFQLLPIYCALHLFLIFSGILCAGAHFEIRRGS